MIAGVVLAAGTSSRLAGRLKQLLPLGGRPIAQHVIDAALAAGLDDVVVVLGHKAEEVRAGLELRPPARAVVNPDYASGQSSSLRTGLHALADDIGTALILLGDQPGIRLEAIQTVMRIYEQTGGLVVRASYSGQAGHPVLFERGVWAELEKLEGDRGARDVLADHRDWVVRADLSREPPSDLDTWDEYERMVKGSGD